MATKSAAGQSSELPNTSLGLALASLMLCSYSQVLVCTSALEEGIDVSSCEFVVRFSEVNTTKSFIQGSGRARKKHSMVYAFMNDVDHERAQVASPRNRPTLC